MPVKKILLISQHFWPETFQINNVIDNLRKKKVEITVLTGLPNYPSGKIYKKYKSIKKLYYEMINGISIYRCPIIPRKNGGAIDLILNYLSFLINSFRYFSKLNLNKKFDLVFCYSTSPITSAIPAIYFKIKYKKKAIIWVQDIWPDVVMSTKFIKNKFFYFILKKLSISIYSKFDLILIPFKSFKKKFKEYKLKNKIIYLPNSGYNIINKKQYIEKKILNLLNKNKCFTYAGNIGKAQNITNILDAAYQLKKYKNIYFLIIGDGSELKKIKNIVEYKNLSNVQIIGHKKQQFVQAIQNKSHALLLPLNSDPVYKLYIPNKFQSYLQSKKPIIGICSGETKKYIQRYKIGLCSEPNNQAQLLANILKVFNYKKDSIKKISLRMSKLYNKEFSSSKQTNKILEIFNSQI